MALRRERCQSCRFYEMEGVTRGEPGRCHRYPPSVNGLMVPMPPPPKAPMIIGQEQQPPPLPPIVDRTCWPRPLPAQWCGEWQPEVSTVQ